MMNQNPTLSGRAPLGLGTFALPVSVTAQRGAESPLPLQALVSPYFQHAETRKVGTGRDIRFIESLMAVNRAVIRDLEAGIGNDWFVVPYFLDGTTGAVVSFYGVDFSIAGAASAADVIAAAEIAVNSYAGGQGYSLSGGIIWPFATGAAARAFNYPSLAINTARQASTTQDALVVASVEIDASLSLTTGAKGSVTLQYADDSAFTTNVVSPSFGVNGNTGTLVIGLNTVGAGGGNVVGIVPAGKYYRLHTTNTTGTPTYGTPTVQEVLL